MLEGGMEEDSWTGGNLSEFGKAGVQLGNWADNRRPSDKF